MKTKHYAISILIFSLLLTASLYADNPTEEYFSIVEQYYKKKDYQGTLNQLNYFVKKFPRSNVIINAYQTIASAYEALGNHSQAILTYREIIEKFPNTQHERSASLSIAYIQFTLMQNYTLAMQTYQEIYLNNNHTKYGKIALEYLVSICEKLKKYQEGINFINDMIKKYPNYPNTYTVYLPIKARFQITLNKHKQAVRTYQTLIKFLEENPGNIIKNMKQKMEEACAELARLYTLFRFPDLSIKYYLRAIENSSDNSSITRYALFANESYSFLGQHNERLSFLLKVYDKIGFHNEESAAIAHAISIIFTRLKKTNDEFYWKLKALASGFQENSSEIEGLIEKTTKTLFAAKKYTLALEFYLTALKVYKGIPAKKQIIYTNRMVHVITRCFYYAGECEKYLNNQSNAKELFRLVIKLSPNSIWAKKALKAVSLL